MCVSKTGIRTTFPAWFAISIATLLVLSIAANAPAETKQMKDLAARLDEGLAHSGHRKVVVFDFDSTDTRLLPVGSILADELTAALTQSDEKLHVESRVALKQLMKTNYIDIRNTHDPGIATCLARDSGAQALISGTMTRDGDRLNISVDSYAVADGKGIVFYQLSLPLTDELRQTISNSLEPPLRPTCQSDDAIPCAGKDGYSPLHCIKCPEAKYSSEAASRFVQGTVIIRVVVNADGRTQAIGVVTAVPDGLTANAVGAVKNWRFEPAIGPDGKPATVQTVIEVSFHLYRRDY